MLYEVITIRKCGLMRTEMIVKTVIGAKVEKIPISFLQLGQKSIGIINSLREATVV